MMENITAARIFAALGNPNRLAVFRLLMRRAPHGVRPGEIAEALEMKQNTLSHHFADLEAVGLIQSQRDGRSILYSVQLENTAALVGYLVTDFCRSRPDLSLTLSSTPEFKMPTRPMNVLFICSGNSARSIFAEAILTKEAQGKFHAYSAGTRERSELNPFALELLKRNDHDVAGLRSKNIVEFQRPDAPEMDFVFTVCDAAANEECAPWTGQPITAHWGVADPVKATGTDAEKALAFARAYGELRHRIIAFVALPYAELEKVALQKRLDDIGQSGHD